MTRLTRRQVLLLPTVLLPSVSAAAQATPTPARSPNALSKSAVVGRLPTDADVVFMHLVFAGKGATSQRQMSGTTLFLVTDGEITLTTDQSISLGPSGTLATPCSALPPGDVPIRAGEGTVIGRDTTIAFENRSASGADVLLLQILPTAESATPEARASISGPGVETTLLGNARATFASSRGILIVERAVQPPASSSTSSTLMGVEIGEIESGGARVLFLRGSNYVESMGEKDVEANSRVDLTPGDQYASLDGSLVWRAGDTEPLVVLRAQTIPIPTAR